MLLLAEYMISKEKTEMERISHTSFLYFAEGLFANGSTAERGSKRRSVIQLLGRVLLIFLFLSITFGGDTFSFFSPTFSSDGGSSTGFFYRLFRFLFIVIGLMVCIMVVVGFKARWSATFCVAILSVSNILVNSWWSMSRNNPMRDFRKYDFFQTLSVMGGFLLLLGMGPGQMSVDEKKKNY